MRVAVGVIFTAADDSYLRIYKIQKFLICGVSAAVVSYFQEGDYTGTAKESETAKQSETNKAAWR